MEINDIYNGKTRAYGIIGNPVEHSFSPVLQNTIAKKMGINMAYLPFTVEKGSVKKALEGAYLLGFDGFNVTVPHKVEVIESLKDIDPLAEKIGAVNTLKKVENGYKGYNTDILGLGKCLDIEGVEIKDKTVIVLGAGGAAKAAAVMAAVKEAAEIYIVNRTVEKAENIKKSLEKYYKGKVYAIGYDALYNIEKVDCLINTTSAGMGDGNTYSVVEDKTFFKKVPFVVDIVYVPWETQIMKDASEMGTRAVNGFAMLIYQGIASFEIWHDISIDNETAKEIKESLEKYYNGGKNGR